MDIWSKDVEQFIQEELEKPFFLSIGLYEHSEDEFFGRLLSEHVDTFCDLRQRRSTRNPAYAFANSRRLQQTLSDLGIRYFHCKELAPSRETRAKQRAEDKRLRLKKRERCALEQAFIEAYEQECLATFDSHAFMQRLGPEAHVIALFCVENEELACHRWLVATRLANDLGLEVGHMGISSENNTLLLDQYLYPERYPELFPDGKHPLQRAEERYSKRS